MFKYIVALMLITFISGLRAETVTQLTANAGPDQTVAAAADTGKAQVTLDGSASADPAGATLTYKWTGPFEENAGTATDVKPVVTLPIGKHTITLEVSNGTATATDTVDITVEDNTAPVISKLTVDPKLLWPPNHKMVNVTVTADTYDSADAAPVCKIVEITSDEPDDGEGDGNTTGDFEITGDMGASVRAERAGPGDGRTYTIKVECTDAAGNVATGEVTVIVPHDKRQYKELLAELEEENPSDPEVSSGSNTGKKPGKGKKPKKPKKPKKGKGAKKYVMPSSYPDQF
ncbi:MAG TPA: hypothetical protein VEJ63_09995 [Planctomycetota bacterium]|nr:hypothetical protein [Planctomycetota bacterium]